jgi:hypothetical protein
MAMGWNHSLEQLANPLFASLMSDNHNSRDGLLANMAFECRRQRRRLHEEDRRMYGDGHGVISIGHLGYMRFHKAFQASADPRMASTIADGTRRGGGWSSMNAQEQRPSR